MQYNKMILFLQDLRKNVFLFPPKPLSVWNLGRGCIAQYISRDKKSIHSAFQLHAGYDAKEGM